MGKKKKSTLNSKKLMRTFNNPYSTDEKVNLVVGVNKKISQDLLEEITQALQMVKGYGSIEIYVQDHSVTQITVRNIKKTKHILAE